MEQAFSRDIQSVYLEQLRKDRCFQKLSADRQQDLVEQSIAAGQKQAEDLKRTLPSIDRSGLLDWCRQQGISVEHCDTKYDLPYLAEYLPRRNKIILYTGRIRRMQTAVEANHPEYFAQHSLEEMCLCHEAFHFLECRENGGTGRLIFSQSRHWGICRRHYFEEGSEIAAHTFVAVLLNLDFHTYLLPEQA